MTTFTQKNWTLFSGIHRPGGLRQHGAERLRLPARWSVCTAALIIVFNLGLLSPLSCIIHCAIHRLTADDSAVAFFLCGEHSQAQSTSAPAPAPLPGPTPRALYELLSLPLQLLILVSLPVAHPGLPLRAGLRSLLLAPPTPPPRLSLA